MNSGLYSVLYLMYFIILDSVLYFADIECGFSHGQCVCVCHTFCVKIGFCEKLCINCYFSYAIISDKIYLGKMAAIISDNM